MELYFTTNMVLFMSCVQIFVRLIFVGVAAHENQSRMKISACTICRVGVNKKVPFLSRATKQPLPFRRFVIKRLFHSVLLY